MITPRATPRTIYSASRVNLLRYRKTASTASPRGVRFRARLFFANQARTRSAACSSDFELMPMSFILLRYPRSPNFEGVVFLRPQRFSGPFVKLEGVPMKVRVAAIAKPHPVGGIVPGPLDAPREDMGSVIPPASFGILLPTATA